MGRSSGGGGGGGGLASASVRQFHSTRPAEKRDFYEVLGAGKGADKAEVRNRERGEIRQLGGGGGRGMQRLEGDRARERDTHGHNGSFVVSTLLSFAFLMSLPLAFQSCFRRVHLPLLKCYLFSYTTAPFFVCIFFVGGVLLWIRKKAAHPFVVRMGEDFSARPQKLAGLR